ncbi:hypothetical protein [Spirosoma fluviale]|uniref:Uncharacterized protein n=1 Tax=Spirosoma fluviale TaxID=1597977 RepID=A0A286GU20_9BACT|nr:hypothetical protein [Spirosoma fluviale]SOD99057.1 hypothetical protein SAMN06269250_6261 [Spirosoma fluviale]
MKAKQLDELVSELKSLRKKVNKSAEAHEKVVHKLAQVEAIAKLLLQQLGEDQNKELPKAKRTKKDKKKALKINAEPASSLVPVSEVEPDQ